MKRNIPFLERFRTPMQKGIKTVTSRTRRMAAPGDTFWAFGLEFEVTLVERVRLDLIRERMWHAEGCDSPEDFENVWAAIYRKAGFRPAQPVHVHHFKILSREGVPAAAERG